MTTWIRFQYQNNTHIGTISGDEISIHEGDLFVQPSDTGRRVDVSKVQLLTPCTPQKMYGLWNNFHATAEKTGLPHPNHPWYFVMTPNSYAAANTVIKRPVSCTGKILFEGELGIVIGKRCKEVPVESIGDYIFGYTCVNDVTALEHLFAEDDFAHWTRAKCFDGFGVFGPGITTGISPNDLIIKTLLEGDDQVQERQNYPVSDMIFSPYEMVSIISNDVTLEPGDIIACGTSVGAGALKHGWRVKVQIEGVGELVNTYEE